MINTLSIASDLSKAGIERPHAEAIANAIGTRQGDVAMKDFVHAEISGVHAEISGVRAEISTVRAEISAEISTVRAEISAEISGVRTEMSALEARLVRWVVGTVFAASGLLFAALRFIP